MNNASDMQYNIDCIDIGSIENALGNAEFNIAKERFLLAKNILLFLFVLTVIIIVARLVFGERTNDDLRDIFSTVFQSIVPISSLVIGYYFGSKCDKE
ncbi:TPA: hypothetical protein J5F55_003930 [Escherichia coli]|nr:hypothetical protein [Escherichia coli]MEC9712006.1 hypothetical protein [Escherichia coli]MED8707849.1 hypothetical protein [Escherichia coli]HBA3609513.1 hypothetical protein [Escherichia coli]